MIIKKAPIFSKYGEAKIIPMAKIENPIRYIIHMILKIVCSNNSFGLGVFPNAAR